MLIRAKRKGGGSIFLEDRRMRNTHKNKEDMLMPKSPKTKREQRFGGKKKEHDPNRTKRGKSIIPSTQEGENRTRARVSKGQAGFRAAPKATIKKTISNPHYLNQIVRDLKLIGLIRPWAQKRGKGDQIQ